MNIIVKYWYIFKIETIIFNVRGHIDSTFIPKGLNIK